jgi:membrane fusion protein, copper/silver efflux system
MNLMMPSLHLSLPVKACLLLALTGLACSKPRPPQDQEARAGQEGHSMATQRGHDGHSMAASHQDIRGDTLHLAARQQELGALQLDTAALRPIGQQDQLLGIAAVDEEKVTLVSARAKGRLEKLLVRNPGQLVRKGQAAYQIYSEELLAQVQEYRLALQQGAIPDADPQLSRQLVAAARAKLLRWGLSPAQLRQIARQQDPSPYLT